MPSVEQGTLRLSEAVTDGLPGVGRANSITSEPEEPGTFPNLILPFQENSEFYGREKELETITQHLSPKDDEPLRTYTIHGRRGVGKSEIALKFAHLNPCGFDAIFWIQCETSVAIRQSFTRVAVALNLPGSDIDSYHEENLLKIHNWLKRTKKRWLLIFDQVEHDRILRAYWPVAGSGAILITTRKFQNFSKDVLRKAGLIKPLDSIQSWQLLLQLLGDDWKKMEEDGDIPATETAAARLFLERLGGLPLAIHQAAHLITNPDVGGSTVTKTYDIFNERLQKLPERHSSPRGVSEKSLDALWDMIFTSLTPNAKALLGIFAWLSPDAIQAQLFLPQNQNLLDGTLAFCKRDTKHKTASRNLSTPGSAFEKAIQQLVDMELIMQLGPELYAIHRIVQEALNFHDVDELQDRFEIASRLVFEQFPQRRMDESLYDRWNVCQRYIHHGVHLSKKFEDYSSPSKPMLLGSLPEFVELLNNCAWYLHEVGDYEVSARVVKTASNACDDKHSLIYAELRNTDGCRYFELNRLKDCRKAWEVCMLIRKNHLPHDSTGIAAIYNNMGNLELAQGNTEEAAQYYDQAIEIWVNGGDETSTHLALTYLCVGRDWMLRGVLPEALKYTALSDDLLAQTVSGDKGFMANVHYAYGKIHYLQKDFEAASQDYDQCLKICLQEMPIHPITAATYYSLGCVEFSMGRADYARIFLDKARAISELRSPTRDDGPIARILWKTAVVLESDPGNSFAEEAAELRQRAKFAQEVLLAGGEGGLIPFVDQVGSERNEEEHSYDALVPLFFR